MTGWLLKRRSNDRRRRWRDAPDEGRQAETFRCVRPHPALLEVSPSALTRPCLRFRPIGLTLRAATLSQWERALTRNRFPFCNSVESFMQLERDRTEVCNLDTSRHRPPLQKKPEFDFMCKATSTM
jgi:hypothetical protein